MSRRSGMQQKPRYPIAGLSDLKLGTQLFHYDFDASRLTTHTPDVERIQANAGIVGSNLSGGPANLEPRLVTADTHPAARFNDGVDSALQSLVSDAAASTYTSMHTAAPKAIYLLTEPEPNASGNGYLLTTWDATGAAGIALRNGTTNHIQAIVSDDSGTLICNFTEAKSNGFADDTPYLIALMRDGERWYIALNGVIKNSANPSSAEGTAAPDQTLRFGNFVAAGGNTYGGKIWMAACYTGADHVGTGLHELVYEQVKITYPGITELP